ncbi:HEPN domain-containing protein [Candidatus Bathyarchaeota archaeon]|nr:HEPN domain-containing protein [Candidatus Bathyarchaeota archaeon]
MIHDGQQGEGSHRGCRDFLGAARDLYGTDRWSKVCFNCQQAAGLAFKAALSFYGLDRRGHSLLDLLDELSSTDPRFEAFRESARILNQYYIPTRYANAFASGPAKRHFTESQARVALDMAASILDEMRRIVAEGEA